MILLLKSGGKKVIVRFSKKFPASSNIYQRFKLIFSFDGIAGKSERKFNTFFH
jgi:hypothetical protein